jgi:hypothetical protein
MKKLLVILSVVCALALTANAAEGGKKKPLTDEQKAVQKEMIEKYDANKDGKIDKEERAKMSKEDKEKWNKAFPHQGKKQEKTDDKK